MIFKGQFGSARGSVEAPLGNSTCVDVIVVFARVSLCLFGWEGSRAERGNAWGIIDGQFGYLQSIFDKSRERMITCDVI